MSNTHPLKNEGLKKYSYSSRVDYHGGLLGATGDSVSDEARGDNSLFWTIFTIVSGLIVFEIVISNDGFSLKAQSKDR